MTVMTQCRFVKRDIGKGHRQLDDGGDCTVRAFALAAGIPYAQAWRMLYEAQGRWRTCCFAISRFLDEEPQTFGVKRRLSFPAKSGEDRMNANAFAAKYPDGSFILRMSNHVAAMEDGVLYDRWDCRRKCVYTAWEIEPLPAIYEPAALEASK